MDARYINPFITASFSVFEALLGQVPERGTPVAQRTDCTVDQVNVMVGLTGALSGVVLIGMPLMTADKIASTMIGQPIRTFDNLAASAIAELGNMLCGNACMELSGMGLQCDMTPPTLIRGRNVKMNTLDIPAITVPFDTQHGRLTITIGLTQAHHYVAA